nr:phage baseplate assembly protein V [Escherichia coli]
MVTEINTDTWKVRVQTGGLTTNWIQWNSGRAGKFKIWIPPSPGEQVFLLCPGGNPETAVSAGSLYSNDNPPPGSLGKRNGHYRARTVRNFAINAQESSLTARGIKNRKPLRLETSITLDAPKGGMYAVAEDKDIRADQRRNNERQRETQWRQPRIKRHHRTHPRTSGVKSGSDTSGGPQ